MNFVLVKELTAAYDEYVGLLEKAEGSLLGLAYAHGHRTPEAQVATGKALREKIADLKSRLNI